MIRKFLVLIVMLIVSIAFSSCYLHIVTPLDTDVNRTSLGKKTGKASIHSILWLVAWGDAGVAAAAQNGNISVINHIDRERFAVLWGAYYKETTLVYGE